MAKKEGSTSDLLLENTIALQKTLVDLASEVKILNKKVSQLLELFESASTSFKKSRAEGIPAKAPGDLLEKIDMLVEQNKTLAKGLLLLEKSIHGRVEEREIRPAARPSKPLKLKKKKFGEEEEEGKEEDLFAGLGEGKGEEGEEYKPQPLPEFSF